MSDQAVETQKWRLKNLQILEGMLRTMDAYSSISTMWLLSSKAPYCIAEHTSHCKLLISATPLDLHQLMHKPWDVRPLLS